MTLYGEFRQISRAVSSGYFKSVFALVFSLLIMVGSIPGFAEEEMDVKKEVESINKRLSDLETSSGAPAADKKTKTIHSHWKDGLHFEYEKDGHKLQWGGRIHNDWLFWTGNQDIKNTYGETDENGIDAHLKDGTEFRRARLFASGVLYNHVLFKAEFDFATGSVIFKDVYLGLTEVPLVGEIIVGHHKEPFSLEELTSANYITFLERGLPNVFVPSFNSGVQIRNHIAKRLTWAVGVFRETDDLGIGFGDAGYNISTRITGAPVYMDEGRILVHLGGAFSYRNPTDDIVRYRQRPEAHLTPRFLDTRDPVSGADLQADGVQLYGGEVAAVFGPASLQAEYMAAIVDVLPTFFTNPPAFTTPIAPFPYSGGGDAFFQGAYVFVSVFLTGENRPYKPEQGVFSRVKPKRVFMDGKGGYGAWEVAARYSHLDLDDGPYNRQLGLGGIGPNGFSAASFGKMDDYTMALNWYLNPNTRVMFNYIISDPDPNGLAHLFNTRFQIDF